MRSRPLHLCQFLSISACVLATSVPVNTAEAIPAFARKYGTACTTCHVGGPRKLNAFGESFKLNGYRMPRPTETDQRRHEEIQLGAPARKQLFPNTVWPGELPQAVGISFLGQHRFSVDLERNAGQSRFKSPSIFAMVLGGTLGDGFGFFGEYVLFVNGNSGLGHLLIAITDPFEKILPRGALSFRVGRFAPAIEPYPDNNRRTISHNSVSDYRVVPGGFRLRDRQAGIEAYGRPTGRILWTTGIVNGENPLDDATNHKDLYAALEFKLGGSPYLDPSPASPGSPSWHDNSLTLGLGGWFGRHQIQPTDGTPFANKFGRLVGKLRFKLFDLDTQAAIAWGRDKNPTGAGTSVDSLAWTVQSDYVVYPWLQFVLRYDELHVDAQETSRVITPHVSLFARMNVWLRLETAIDIGRNTDRPEIQLDLSYAF